MVPFQIFMTCAGAIGIALLFWGVLEQRKQGRRAAHILDVVAAAQRTSPALAIGAAVRIAADARPALPPREPPPPVDRHTDKVAREMPEPETPDEESHQGWTRPKEEAPPESGDPFPSPGARAKKTLGERALAAIGAGDEHARAEGLIDGVQRELALLGALAQGTGGSTLANEDIDVVGFGAIMEGLAARLGMAVDVLAEPTTSAEAEPPTSHRT